MQMQMPIELMSVGMGMQKSLHSMQQSNLYGNANINTDPIPFAFCQQH